MKTLEQEVSNLLKQTDLDWEVRKENLVAISTREQTFGHVLPTF